MGIIHIPSDGRIFEVVIDDEDLKWVTKVRWHIHGEVESYPKVFRNKKVDGKWTTTRLHREIWEHHNGPIPTGKLVDHANRDTLDNQKNNLRLANESQSSINRGSAGKSKHKGVYQHKDGTKWCANIRVEGLKKYLGLFETEDDAAEAYDLAALEHHDHEFVVLNFPRSWYE